MTFSQIWDQLKRKQPKLENSEATMEITAGNLRKLLRQVYDQGRNSVARLSQQRSVERRFADLFGGGK